MRYADWHPDAGRVRAAFIKVNERDSLKQVMSDWYGNDAHGCYPESPGLPKAPDATVVSAC